jgi:hypothetical protein
VKLPDIRWGVRGVLALGVAASTIANILHAEPNNISRTIAAWPPLALLLTIELMARIPVHRLWLAIARLGAAGLIASIAAYVSYNHMAGVALRYGESSDAAHLLPLSVDGLIVVASICLVELGGRIRTAEVINEGGSNGTAGEGSEAGPARGEVPGEGPEHSGGDGEGHRGDPAGEQVEVVPSPAQIEPPKQAARKPHTANPERIRRAYAKEPDADPKAVARRLKLSPATVKRYRPVAETVNGKVSDLAAQ